MEDNFSNDFQKVQLNRRNNIANAFSNNLNKGESDASTVERKSRLSQKIVDILNLQIHNELQSSQLYRGMSCWADDKGLPNASNWYFNAASEELKHMEKIYKYLYSRNCKAIVPTCSTVEQEFSGIREVVEKSLEHEIIVSTQWETISNDAKEIGDNTTYEFAQWFLKEQIEEEEKFRNFLFQMDLDMPKWKIEELFQ
jgi:ferritin